MVESIDASLIEMGYPLQSTVGLRNKSSGKVDKKLSGRGIIKMQTKLKPILTNRINLHYRLLH